MPWNWKDQLARELKAEGVDMKSLSLAAGLHETAVRDLLVRWPDPRLSTVLAIARARGRSLSELVEGGVSPAQRVPIIGCASAGERWEPTDGNLGEVEMRIEGGEPVAIEVRGDSMVPVYRSGELLIAVKRVDRVEELAGQDCIVMTDEGERLIKFLAKGTARGRFDLRSYNPANKDIQNVRLAWAAPILWVKRSR